MDRRLGVLHDLQGFFAAGCFEHAVTAQFQRACSKAAHRFLVFDEKDRILPGHVAWARAFGFGCDGRTLVNPMTWQINLKRRALADIAVDCDEAAALLDDAVDSGKAETRS